MFQGPDGIFTTLTLGCVRDGRLENARWPANKLVQRMRACKRFDVRERLDAGRGIVVDQDVVHGKAGTGE